MKVLIACEFSGTVRDSFIKKGHNAISCDILPTEKDGPHYEGDVLDILFDKWDLIIAHPPCTYLANSGVSWLRKNNKFIEPRYSLMKKAVDFFNHFRSADLKCDKVCIENPIPHKYGIGKTYSQIIQPWQFGHGETKATCLWLKGLPKLKPTKIVDGRVQRLHKLPPSKDRWKIRSKTYQGIADAMADQWSLRNA